jgi:hypothetical protein
MRRGEPFSHRAWLVERITLGAVHRDLFWAGSMFGGVHPKFRLVSWGRITIRSLLILAR